MLLDVSPIRAVSGERICFDFPLDLSKLELYGEYPIPEAVRVSGYAVNRADMLELIMDIDYSVRTRCARCLKELIIPVSHSVCRPMADSVANADAEDDDIIILSSGTVDIDQIATETIVLEAEMSYLCSEDCRGLCPKCGADLNEGDCGCPSDTDERFAALSELLKGE